MMIYTPLVLHLQQAPGTKQPEHLMKYNESVVLFFLECSSCVHLMSVLRRICFIFPNMSHRQHMG